MIEPNHQPTPFEIADGFLRRAVEACGRIALREAQDNIAQARRILETEEAFREAREGKI